MTSSPDDQNPPEHEQPSEAPKPSEPAKATDEEKSSEAPKPSEPAKATDEEKSSEAPKPSEPKPRQARKSRPRNVIYIDPDTLDLETLNRLARTLDTSTSFSWPLLNDNSSKWDNLVDFARSDDRQKLREEISQLQAQLRKQLVDAEERTDAQVASLKNVIKELQAKEQLAYLLRRLSSAAGDAVLVSPKLKAEFGTPKECNAFVMSVDLRQSTALMLKARTPQAFATFLDDLSEGLAGIIKNLEGVFDKFTGDGVLAFFPTFYSGADAGYYAIQAAIECHAAFSKLYKSARGSFSSILTNVGLGIGIDYGKVHLLQLADGLTVVGAPVVYACRLGGAPGGLTYLNQPAFEEIQKTASRAFLTSEVELEIKHEGPMLAYSVVASGARYEPAEPRWKQIARGNATEGEPEVNSASEGTAEKKDKGQKGPL